MRVICLQENLKNNLSILERVSSKDKNLPILNNVYLKTESGFLKSFTTDLEMGVEIFIPCKIEKAGEIVLPIKLISSFINNLPNTKLSLEEKKDKLFINSDDVKTTIPLSNKEEFPIIPKVGDKNVIKINPEALKNGLAQVINSISSNTSLEISGILFDFKDEFLKLVSTDKFRLSIKTIFKDNYKIEGNYKFILPSKTCQELLKIIDQEDYIEIYLEQNQVLFKLKNINLISRLITGEFPNYEQFIPKTSKTKVLFNKDEFLSKIKLASLFSSKTTGVKFIVDTNKKSLQIQSSDVSKGEFISDVNIIDVKGEDLEVYFNYKYITDGLLNITDEEVIFELNGQSGIALLKPKNEHYNYIVLPLRV